MAYDFSNEKHRTLWYTIAPALDRAKIEFGVAQNNEKLVYPCLIVTKSKWSQRTLWVVSPTEVRYKDSIQAYGDEFGSKRTDPSTPEGLQKLVDFMGYQN